MSAKTRKRLEQVANTLEQVVMKTLAATADAIQLVMVDLVYGKPKYRKRAPQPRPIIHRTYNRTVIYRQLLPSERVTPPRYRKSV